MKTGFDRLHEDLSKIGDPECKHVLENGSSAYEWAQYGIEYIKTCSICCNLDYSSRSLVMPELVEKITTNALIDKYAANMITLGNLKDAAVVRPVYAPLIEKLEKEVAEIITELSSRGIDMASRVDLSTLSDKER